MQSREIMRRSGNGISKSIERLSTGLRINSGADDPAGLHLSRAGYANRMGRIQAALENLQLGINFMDLRYEGLVNSRDALMKLRDLAVRSANEAVLNDDQRADMQDEVTELLDAIDNNRNMLFQMDLGSNEGPKPLFDPGKIDVVWVMDQTGSMGAWIGAVAAAAPTMFSTLEAAKFTVRMGAVGFNSGAAGGPLNPAASPPGSPFGALTGAGAKQLQDTSAAFVADVNAIAAAVGGGTERGLDATMEAIYNTAIQGQLTAEPNAQRIFILLTDADSDDNGEFGANNGLNTTAAQRDAVVNTLNSWSIDYYVVNSITEAFGPYPGAGQDADYTDVATRAGGASMNLDPGNAWVSTITSNLSAYGGPWDMRFHFGPGSEDWFDYTLDTVVPATMGISGVNVTTATNAQSSISTIDDAVDFLSEAFRQTGYLRGMLDRIVANEENEYVNLAQVNSNIFDADVAREIVDYTRDSIVQNTAVATMAKSNASVENILSLIDTTLTQDFGIIK